MDAFEQGSGYQRRFFIVQTSKRTRAVVGAALFLLPLLELWREQISINGNWYLFVLDVLCMVAVSVDAVFSIYFKALQSEARGTFCKSAAVHVVLYLMLWATWIMQQLGVARLTAFIMPLLLFVKFSELRLTVTIFVRFCDHTLKVQLVSWLGADRLPAAGRC